MNKLVILLIVLSVFSSCTKEDKVEGETYDMRINHYRNTAQGEGSYIVMLVQEGDQIGSSDWFYFYSKIEGFEYKGGYLYDIKVVKEQVSNPPADESSTKYILSEIVSTEKVDKETTFKIDLKKNGQNYVTSNLGHAILDQIKIDCGELCDDLDEKLNNQDVVIGTFKRSSSSKIKLLEIN